MPFLQPQTAIPTFWVSQVVSSRSIAQHQQSRRRARATAAYFLLVFSHLIQFVVEGRSVRVVLPDLPPITRCHFQRENLWVMQTKGGQKMPRGKKFTAEQIVGKLREAEVELARVKTVPEVAQKLAVTEQTSYRRKREYGGLRTD